MTPETDRDDWLDALLGATAAPLPDDDGNAFVGSVMQAVTAQAAAVRAPLAPQQALARLQALQASERRQRRWSLAAGAAGTAFAAGVLAAGSSWWAVLPTAGISALMAPVGALLVASVVLGLVVGDDRAR